MLKQFLFVVLGGVIGNALRYLTVLLLARRYTGSISLVMLAISLVGCFPIGPLVGLRSDTSYLRLLFITGLYDGSTTFSTFMAKSCSMFHEDAYGLALLYLLLIYIPESTRPAT